MNVFINVMVSIARSVLDIFGYNSWYLHNYIHSVYSRPHRLRVERAIQSISCPVYHRTTIAPLLLLPKIDHHRPKMFPWKLIAVTDVHGLKYFATRATKFLLIGGMSGARNSFLIAALMA